MVHAEEIVRFLNSNVVEVIGDGPIEITEIIPFEEALRVANLSALTWVNDKNACLVDGSVIRVGLLIISPESKNRVRNAGGITLVSNQPRQSFQKIMSRWFGSRRTSGIEKSAFIHGTAVLGKDCYIGHNVIIENDCVLGDTCEILHNTVILKGTVIGKNVRIGANCTIGNYGFGYEKNDKDDYCLIEHQGNVIIHDDVEIHNNTCIDRAVLGSTVIGRNVKIDNLVHIAHGVCLQENCLVIAHAMVAGSVTVGRNSWISPGALVKNKLSVGSDAIVGLGAVVLKNVGDSETVIGNPAEEIEKYKKWSVVRKNLTDSKP